MVLCFWDARAFRSTHILSDGTNRNTAAQTGLASKSRKRRPAILISLKIPHPTFTLSS